MRDNRNQGDIRYLFGGINNRISGTLTPGEDGILHDLESAENVFITDSLGIKSRSGFGPLLREYQNPHSIWSDGGPFLLFVGNGSVNRYSDGLFTKVFSVGDDTKRMFYEQAGTGIVFSNGEEIATILGGEGKASTLTTPNQEFKSKFPPAKYLAMFNGRLYGATDEGLVYSDTYRLTKDDRNFLIPLGVIKMIAPVKGGIFVSFNNKTVFLAGTGPEDFVVYPVHNFPVIDGAYSMTDAAILSDKYQGLSVVFATREGVFAGFDSGQVEEITRKKYVVGDHAYGSVFVNQADSQTQIYVSLAKE